MRAVGLTSAVFQMWVYFETKPVISPASVDAGTENVQMGTKGDPAQHSARGDAHGCSVWVIGG
jgi:hypothetical protein